VDVQTIIDAIDTKLAAIAASPDSVVSYRIGDKSVDKAGMVKYLMEMRKMYTELLKDTPTEDVSMVDVDISAFGEDFSTVIGDDG